MMMADDNEDDNNNDTNAQYKALWNLLTKYGIDRFSNDEELDAYMETVKIATGTSDQQIKQIKEHAINRRNSPLNFGSNNNNDTTDGGTNDLLEEGDDNTDRTEEEARRKASERKAMAHALDELTKYKASIPNGTIDEVPDNDDYDSDVELVGDGGINSNTNNEKKKKRLYHLSMPPHKKQ